MNNSVTFEFFFNIILPSLKFLDRESITNVSLANKQFHALTCSVFSIYSVVKNRSVKVKPKTSLLTNIFTSFWPFKQKQDPSQLIEKVELCEEILKTKLANKEISKQLEFLKSKFTIESSVVSDESNLADMKMVNKYNYEQFEYINLEKQIAQTKKEIEELNQEYERNYEAVSKVKVLLSELE